MNEINIPFQPEFKDAMLAGIKTMTSRNKFYTRDTGDYFNIFGATFVITDLYRIALEHIAKGYWRSEGCQSPDHFIAVWNELHPRKRWVPDQLVCCHEFKRISR